MSWLGALAGGVENLLDRVDQAAGQALKDPDEPEPSSTRVGGGFYLQESWPTTTRPTAIVAASAYSSFSHITQTLPQPPSAMLQRSPSDASAKSRTSRDPDQELFEFLNSSEVVVSKNDSPTQNAGPSSLTNRKSPGGGHEIATVTPVTFSSAGSQNSVVSGHISMPDISESIGSEENRLLQNEVDTLTRDMQTVSVRLQATQEELSRCQRQLESQRRQLTQTEQTCADLRRHDADTREAIAAKDAQIAVLRTRLDEADRELAAKAKLLSDLGSSQDRALMEQMSVSGIQRQTLDSLQEKLNDLETTLSRERDEHQRAIDEATRQHGRLEADRQSLMSEISSLQKTVNRERARSGELGSQLKTVRSQAESAKQELVDYRDKATRILQSKEKLIVSLKDGSTVSKAGGTELAVLASELESARQERDVLREQLQNTQLMLESCRVEMTELESQTQHDSESSRDQLSAFEDQLRAERRRREDAEFDLAKQKQELRSMHEELVKQKSGFQSRIQTRDEEISRLRSQLVAKSMNASNQEELENRLRALTESLIQKQTALESLSTEKNSLIMQMERLERQCREAESSALRAASTVVNVSDDDDAGVRQRVASFMHQSPLDGNVTRRVKMAANVIDRFGIQLGVFLRRYPVARVLVIVYMGLLHLWVMLVMLTYQQEIHESDYGRPLPPAP